MVLTVDRPDRMNALDTATLSELLDAVADTVHTSGVRVIVIGGTPEVFSVGADLHEALDPPAAVRRMELFGQVFEAVGTSPIPTIAAVAGHCIGGGAEIAAACDLRVSSSNATFRFPGAAHGIPVGAAKLVSLVGLGTAKDLLLTARTIDAHEAHRIGFVQRLSEPGAALEDALVVAAAIGKNDEDTVRYLKRMLARFSGFEDHLAAENDAILALAESDGDYRALTATKPGVGSWTGG